MIYNNTHIAYLIKTHYVGNRNYSILRKIKILNLNHVLDKFDPFYLMI